MASALKVNKDLLRERQKCTFDVKELTYIWEGGREFTEERQRYGEFNLDLM